MRTGAASAASAVGARRHNENAVTMTVAGLWRYGDWRHVATGCTAVVYLKLGDMCQLFVFRLQTMTMISIIILALDVFWQMTLTSWRRGVVASVVRRMNEVTLRRARLVLG